MTRKSAVLTPEGKKEAMAQLMNTLKDAKATFGAAKDKLKALNIVKASSTKKYVSFQKAQDSAIVKATKEVARAEGKLEVATKSVAELKAQVPVKAPKAAKILAPLLRVQQSLLGAPTSTTTQ